MAFSAVSVVGRPAALATTRFSAPKCFETLPVPSNDRIRLHDEDGIAPPRPCTRDRDPEQSISCLNLRTFLATFQNEELMTKSQVLCGEMGNNIKLIACPIQGFETLLNIIEL